MSDKISKADVIILGAGLTGISLQSQLSGAR